MPPHNEHTHLLTPLASGDTQPLPASPDSSFSDEHSTRGKVYYDPEKMELFQISDPDESFSSEDKISKEEDDILSTIASVAGNVLEWYDFAIYGYFSDILGQKFFPPTNNESTSIIESFLVFGGAFLVRPVGGVLMGYVGDRLSRKRALEMSIFLMAFPTFAMGCLPSFEVWGWWSTAMLVVVRLIQGLSVGGQLMSSLVFVVEGHERKWWGWYGSWAFTSASLGTFLGGFVGYGMRYYFSYEQLANGCWRIPFLCGVLVSVSGLYLKHNVKEHKRDTIKNSSAENTDEMPTPLQLALSKKLRGSLASVTAAVFLWAGGFYVLFVWLAIFMKDLADTPISSPFAINATALFFCMVILFPFAGWFSDVYGRKLVMTVGAAGIGLCSPMAMKLISTGDAAIALAAQMTLGIFLCMYAAPMCAWLVESFPAESRLTSVAIGYNTAMAIAGGMSPSLATWLATQYGPSGAGYLLSTFAFISLMGMHLAPKHDVYE